jgi:hypothetical protein
LIALVLAGACIFSGCAASAQPKPPAPVNLGDNAALKYWIAFELLHLSPEQEDLLDNWKTLPMDKATIAVLDQHKAALDLLRQAAQVRQCDWGQKNADPNDFMPQMAMARKAARLACLRARYLVGKSDSEGAVSDLLAVFALARQINSDGRSVGFMVEYSIEKTATDATTGCLTRLTREQLSRLASGLDGLPARKGFREAVLASQADAKWQTDRINAMDNEGKKNEFQMIKMIGELMADKPSLARAKVTPEELSEYTRGFDKFQEYFKALAEMGSLPLPEFDRQAEVLHEKMKADCPFVAAMFLPGLPATRHLDAQSETRMALLKAAIVVVLDGPDRIKEFKDPYGDGPFEYSKTGESFALKSKLPIFLEGKPATLTLSVPQ